MIEIDDTQVWTFCFLPHINGMVITQSGGFIGADQRKKPPKFVVKGAKTFNGATYGVFGYGQTDLEAMQNAIDQAQKTEETNRQDLTGGSDGRFNRTDLAKFGM